MTDISISFCGKKFINPYVIAASPSSDSLEKVERAFQAGWGGVVLKTIEPAGRKRTLAEPNMGALDFMGRKQMAFYNYDLCTQQSMEELCLEISYLKRHFPDRIVMASIMASKEEEWGRMIREATNAGTDMIECSLSCPQGDESGKIPASDPETLTNCVKMIRKYLKNDVPLVVKLTPNVTDIISIAKAAEVGGADALCAIDTVKSFIGIDIETGIPKLNVNGKAALGGLSGPAVKPVALGCVAQICKNVEIPVCGVGGISTYEDALEFIMLGCGVVELCTAVSRYGYGMIRKLCNGLRGYMDRKGLRSLDEIRGSSLHTIVGQDELERGWNAVNITNTTKCRRCGACMTACQDCGFGALIKGESGKPVLIAEKCRGCGVCRTVCPADCIEIKPAV